MMTSTVAPARRLRAFLPEALFFAATSSLAVTYWVVTFIG
jgi:hypothetical protein